MAASAETSRGGACRVLSWAAGASFAFASASMAKQAFVAAGSGSQIPSLSTQLRGAHGEANLPAPAAPTSLGSSGAITLSGGLAMGLIASVRGRKRVAAKRTVQKAVSADGTLDDCPFTVWGEKDINFREEQPSSEFKVGPLEVHMPEDLAGDEEAQLRYFEENRLKILQQMKDHGAVVFRGFELTKEAPGFQRFYAALKMDPCVDPLHSVAARDMVDKKSGVYEAVNKESRKRFFVGTHNEMVGNRSPGAAAFVCFKPAEEGGEFLVLDGRKMAAELDRDFLEKLYKREIRYSTAEFPMGFLDDSPLAFAKDMLIPVVENVMKFAVKMKVDFDTELVWSKSDYDNQRILQVRAEPQPPVVRHPATGVPVWFFNVHSHSAWLREQRQKIYGDEGLSETTGASRINRTDCYYADTEESLSQEDLKYLDEVTMKSVNYIKMQKGDVVLLDNYAVQHGRAPFDGTRKHAVTWFKAPDYSELEKVIA